MSWWTSTALPAIAKTVDPTGTLSKAVTRVTTASSGKEVARTFLDPLNVTKYVAKTSSSSGSSSTSGSASTSGDTITDYTTEAVAFFKTPLGWVVIAIAALLGFLLLRNKRR